MKLLALDLRYVTSRLTKSMSNFRYIFQTKGKLSSRSKKRTYGYNVECSECKIQLLTESTKYHSNRFHGGRNVAYSPVVENSQKKLCLFGSNLGINNNNASDGENSRCHEVEQGLSNPNAKYWILLLRHL